MRIFKTLQEARVRLQDVGIKKTGNNTYANYTYFELSDFLPATQKIFKELNLCGVINFEKETATLTIYTTDEGRPEEKLEFSLPMAEVSLKSCHPIQNLGAQITYLTRYLWQNVMEVCEPDAANQVEPEKEKAEKKPRAESKTEPKAEKKPIDAKTMAEHSQSLRNAKDLAELQTVWLAIPSQYHIPLVNVKEEMKEIFKNADVPSFEEPAEDPATEINW